ncbi:MAG: hypothetical protein U0228_38025 [Myxococcaceae bacterium]
MIRAPAAALVVLVLSSSSGCRALHENSIKQRLVQTRFFGRELNKPLESVDSYLTNRKEEAVRTWCELCVVSAESTRDGGRRYCLSSHAESSCVVAHAASPTTTRFEPDPTSVISSQVVRALWLQLDLDSALKADVSDPNELSELARDEEDAFQSRWSFIAGGKVGAVVSYDPPSFTFGGQLGFRYWGSLFTIPGAIVEVENMLQGGRSLVQAHVQGRVELALWSDENTRFFNLPRISFLMGGGPLVGFGRKPALGGRAVLGIHLGHLSTFVTPFFFELGFQVLEVDEQSTSGLRIALGIGF